MLILGSGYLALRYSNGGITPLKSSLAILARARMVL